MWVAGLGAGRAEEEGLGGANGWLTAGECLECTSLPFSLPPHAPCSPKSS